MLQFSVLSSGSRANCLYVASSGARILIDCGLSARQAVSRMDQLGLDPEAIDAIVITHEHSDHVAGVRVFAQRFDVPVYVNAATYDASAELQSLSCERIRFFDTTSGFSIGDLLLEPFSIVHDAADPVAFRVSSGGRVLGIVTDLGHVTTLVRERTRGLDAVVLESNHDPQMLQDSRYPWQVKQRIAGRSGHLSNHSAGELLAELAAAPDNRLQVAVAGHISENTNTPELALEMFHGSWSSAGSAALPGIVAACALRATELFKL